MKKQYGYRPNIYISLEWEMRAEKREINQIPSALLQKFSLKINIVAYGGAARVLVALDF